VLAANLNAPGSWHDSRVAKPIYNKLQHNKPDRYYLVADSVFPRGTQNIAGRIRILLKAGGRLEGTQQEIEKASNLIGNFYHTDKQLSGETGVCKDPLAGCVCL
jgi:hypothetical protein